MEKLSSISDLSKINLWTINDWVHRFVKKANNKLIIKDRAKAKIIKIKSIHDIFNSHKYSLFRYVAVKSKKLSLDSNWVYRSKKKYKQYWGLTCKMLTRKKFKCGVCNLTFIVDDHIALHHFDGNHKNDLHKNLQVLHRSDHQPIHRWKQRKAKA